MRSVQYLELSGALRKEGAELPDIVYLLDARHYARGLIHISYI